MTPQIVGHWLDESDDNSTNTLYERVFPFSLRPQAHEIIRTWAFYTIVKSQYHFQTLPWNAVLISGWGLAGEGMGKISKSRGSGGVAPLDIIRHYSADAVRYWATSTGPGKDTLISEDKIQLGAKLVTKLWNVARFAEPFIDQFLSSPATEDFGDFSQYTYTPADRWILARLQRLIRRVTTLLETYDYAAAKSEIESFFWQDLADNYLEMSKVRLYGPTSEMQTAGFSTIYQLLHAIIQLFAPFLPFITEEIYRRIFWEHSSEAHIPSIHRSDWPLPKPALEDEDAEVMGGHLIAIVSAVRRYKSERSLPLGAELNLLKLYTAADISISKLSPQKNMRTLHQTLELAELDLRSATRARQIVIVPDNDIADHVGEMLTTDTGILLQIMV
jgi:valyl-tRNA synthetase